MSLRAYGALNKQRSTQSRDDDDDDDDDEAASISKSVAKGAGVKPEAETGIL